MAVVAFVRPEPSPAPAAAGVHGSDGEAEVRLRRYGRVMKICFLLALAAWGALQAGCLLSLFLNFRSGIVAGAVDGTIAFKFWPPVDYFSPTHALAAQFAPQTYPPRTAILYALILAVASAPVCGALLHLARLFDLYSRGAVFTRRTACAMRRAGHCIMATGWSPLLLGPAAHAIGVLKPVTGLTAAMIACVVLGLVLLAVAHVMEIGRQMQQEREDIL